MVLVFQLKLIEGNGSSAIHRGDEAEGGREQPEHAERGKGRGCDKPRSHVRVGSYPDPPSEAERRIEKMPASPKAVSNVASHS